MLNHYTWIVPNVVLICSTKYVILRKRLNVKPTTLSFCQYWIIHWIIGESYCVIVLDMKIMGWFEIQVDYFIWNAHNSQRPDYSERKKKVFPIFYSLFFLVFVKNRWIFIKVCSVMNMMVPKLEHVNVDSNFCITRGFLILTLLGKPNYSFKWF